MFGFLTPQARDNPDPLLTPKTASGWLRQLPTLDVIGRQQHVMRAFEGMRQARKGSDLNRVAAVEFLVILRASFAWLPSSVTSAKSVYVPAAPQICLRLFASQ